MDEATVGERQSYVFALINEILQKEFRFSDKDKARKFFLELRQKFINWNSAEFESAEFKTIENEIKEKISQKE